MDTEIDEIISGITKATSEYCSVGLPNVSNVHLAILNGFQLLFGVTSVDPITGDYEGYKYNLEKEINAKGNCKHLGWPFSDIDLVSKTLEGLSSKYNVGMDVKRMLRDIKIPEGRYIYLVITIVVIPVIVNK